MGVLMVARDMAPSQAFDQLYKELVKRGIAVTAFLGHGKSLENYHEEMNNAVVKADLVLVGMSSSVELSLEEINVAVYARLHNIPYGLYADTYGCYNREWFANLCYQANFLFVINSEEAAKASKVFPNTQIIVSGNSVWEDFYFPKMTREEVREKLGVQNNELMVLSPGSKSPVVNCILWGAIVEAVNNLFPHNWKVFLSAHPGDTTDPAFYGDLIKFSRVPVRLIPKDVMSVSDMIPGCDIFVESASTTGIEAAHQRKPVIDYFSEIALARNEFVFGAREWEPCKLGVAYECSGLKGSEFLATIMNRLANSNDWQIKDMRRRQEEVYPKPSERGTAVKIMAEVLKMHARH